MRHRRPHRVPAHLRVPDALRRLLRDETLGDLGERVLVAADDLVRSNMCHEGVMLYSAVQMSASELGMPTTGSES